MDSIIWWKQVTFALITIYQAEASKYNYEWFSFRLCVKIFLFHLQKKLRKAFIVNRFCTQPLIKSQSVSIRHSRDDEFLELLGIHPLVMIQVRNLTTTDDSHKHG